MFFSEWFCGGSGKGQGRIASGYPAALSRKTLQSVEAHLADLKKLLAEQ